MGRAPCCDKARVKKGPWSPEEDAKLKDYIEQHGTGGNWIALPQKIGLNRCGKSCRLRWLNYLRPNIKHGGFSEEEDNIICSLYINIGSRWSIIAAQLPGRTDNDIKNYWNTKLKKKLLGMQRKDQRARTNRRLEMDIKSENYMIKEAIGSCSPLLEAQPLPSIDSNEETNFKGQNFLVKHGGLNIQNNHYYNFNPSEISCAQNQLLGNPIAKHAASMHIINGTCCSSTSEWYPINWIGAYSFQGNNDFPSQIHEIPCSDSQHFDGLESFYGVDMVKSSPMIITNSPEYHPTIMSNLELCQEFGI